VSRSLSLKAPASAGPSAAAEIVSGNMIRIAPFSSSSRRALAIVMARIFPWEYRTA
jgi:hypothetical protein